MEGQTYSFNQVLPENLKLWGAHAQCEMVEMSAYLLMAPFLF